MGADRAATEAQLGRFFSPARCRGRPRASERAVDVARRRRADLAAGAPVDRGDRGASRAPALREAFVDLCRGSVGAYLGRFGFQSELLEAMYAVTDGFTGLCGDWDTPGSGMNFLAHNMCRLPGSDGTWMVVRGGMGTVTQVLADAAQHAGAEFVLGTKVADIETRGSIVTGVSTRAGRASPCARGDRQRRPVSNGFDARRWLPRDLRRASTNTAVRARASRSTSVFATCPGSPACPSGAVSIGRRFICCPSKTRGRSSERRLPSAGKAACHRTPRSSGTSTRRSTLRFKMSTGGTARRCSVNGCRTRLPKAPGSEKKTVSSAGSWRSATGSRRELPRWSTTSSP